MLGTQWGEKEVGMESKALVVELDGETLSISQWMTLQNPETKVILSSSLSQLLRSNFHLRRGKESKRAERQSKEFWILVKRSMESTLVLVLLQTWPFPETN
jgi:hypothetical protein